MLQVDFPCFCCRLLTFFKTNFFRKSFRHSIRVSKGLDPDQDRHSVGPDLGPNCLQRILANDKGIEPLPTLQQKRCIIYNVGLKLRVHTKKKKFLFFNQNICCVYSKEPSQ